MAQEILTQKRLKELLYYSVISGKFYSLTSRGNRAKGSEAGSINKINGYNHLTINWIAYTAHRLAFLYINGDFPDEADHINHCRSANMWINLREVSHRENSKNRSMRSDNTSKITGVFLDKSSGKWIARIRIKERYEYLGRFSSINDAAIARKSAEVKYDFHPNHGRKRNGK